MWAFSKSWTHLTLEGYFFWFYKGFHFSRKDLLTLIDRLIYKRFCRRKNFMVRNGLNMIGLGCLTKRK